MKPTSEELRSRSVRVKNRRPVSLNKLIHDGQYFSEDVMREMWQVSGFKWKECGNAGGVFVRDVDEEVRESCFGRGLGRSSRGWVWLRGIGLVTRESNKEEEEEEEEEEAVKNANGVVQSPEMPVDHSDANNGVHWPIHHSGGQSGSSTISRRN